MYGSTPVYKIDDSREVVVRICKGNAKRYPKGTKQHLNGQRGYIVQCNELSMWGVKCPGRAYKVRFHRPVKAWWGKFKINAYWFSPADLKKTRL